MSEENKTGFDEALNSKVMTALNKMPIALPEHIKEDYERQKHAGLQRQMIQSDLSTKLTMKKDPEDNEVFYLSGRIQINPQTGKPATLDEIIRGAYKNHLQPPTEKDFQESKLKTKADVMTFLGVKLHPKGLKQGSAQWNAEYTRILTEQGITA